MRVSICVYMVVFVCIYVGMSVCMSKMAASSLCF